MSDGAIQIHGSTLGLQRPYTAVFWRSSPTPAGCAYAVCADAAACVLAVRLLIWLDVKNEGKSWHVDKHYPMTYAEKIVAVCFAAVGVAGMIWITRHCALLPSGACGLLR